jgi:hypothetical protein
MTAPFIDVPTLGVSRRVVVVARLDFDVVPADDFESYRGRRQRTSAWSTFST